MNNPGAMREPTAPGEGLKVIHASLYRMGTRSMAEAYTILGYKVHHAFTARHEGPAFLRWKEMEEAAEATWPSIPGATPRPPFTRADWDALWGADYEITTDLASPFVPELIKAYPEAKVVIVQRDFEAWWTSYSQNILERIWRPKDRFVSVLMGILVGYRPMHSVYKTLYGFYGVKSKAELDKACCKKGYERYFQRVREMVPPERRLEYKLGDGWEPLCSFLDVEVPEGVPFPRKNDGTAFNEELDDMLVTYVLLCLKALSVSTTARVLVGSVCGWLAYCWLSTGQLSH